MQVGAGPRLKVLKEVKSSESSGLNPKLNSISYHEMNGMMVELALGAENAFSGIISQPQVTAKP